MNLEIIKTIEQTLYREARLLDQERYKEWVGMLTDDIHYHMPGIETRYRRDKTEQVHDLTRMAFYNDNLEDLKKRLRRLETGTAWSEDPATRYTHLITNIEVVPTEKEDEVLVYSNFLAYRNRNEKDQDTLIGNREDIWRKTAEGYKLAKRLIILKQNVLLSKNLNIYL
ncbi:3-phenylpropionate dioxygenase [Rugosibacter aromaticivorans]|uniref:3-phenylpropionate dioxygenase n=2 Tax=Bacteria TaxID=2 RepID=A0A0C5J975_9PROT|nr:ring-hydroxylating dioxygenase small subunit [bacterium enrichment culture clone pahAd6]AJP48209.1 3-phenylpropionate dioxygenase [Rugosibacter aromaticivorans]TBR14895.1 MAG: 3-phenylpropionate/cinnamic acid dioxygenase subunit beta [Rugosibacter sp.]